MKQVNDAPVGIAPPKISATLFLACPDCGCDHTFGISVESKLEGYGPGESHFRSCAACGWKSRNVFVQDERFDPHEYATLDAPTEPFSEN